MKGMGANTESGWRAFWNRGGWWKALIVVVAYAVVYQLIGLGVGAVWGGAVDPENLLATPESIFVALTLPILLGGVVLVLFGWSLGWLRELFGRQPVTGSWWMWIAVVLVIVPVILRLVATNWSAYSVAIVLTMLATGLCIGFAEELLTRGFVVNLVRKAGHGERLVFVLSSLFFALLHSVNLLSGQSPLQVGLTVIYTFGFGAMMYLSLRVTGRLIWPILLHAATDPTTFLATGGVDAHTASEGSAGLLSLAGIFNYVYIVFALLAIFLVKGRAAEGARTAP